MMASFMQPFLTWMSEQSPLLGYSILALAIFLFSLNHLFPSKWKLPPGPLRYPILGNLPQLVSGGSLPHRTLAGLATKHFGPYMTIWMGPSALNIVVSTAESLREVLHDLDGITASRQQPLPLSAQIMSFEGKGLIFAPIGPGLSVMRRLCKMTLFTRRRLDAWEAVRREEVANMIEDIRAEGKGGDGTVKLRPHLKHTTLNNISRMCIGKRLEFSKEGEPPGTGDEVIRRTGQIFELATPGNLLDNIPVISRFLPAFRECHDVNNFFRGLFGAQIREKQQALKERQANGGQVSSDSSELPQDFLEALLTADGDDALEEASIMALLGDVLLAGFDTTAVTSEWALLELVNRPDVLRKLQSELDEALGPPSAPFSSLQGSSLEEKLLEVPLLTAVVKETLRHHPIGPLAIPHVAKEDVTFGKGKFTAPKGTTFLLNIWASMHDPAVFPDPSAFQPERFLHRKRDHKGTDYEYLPFGSGRRMCPGYPLAYPMLHLMIGSVAYTFDFDCPAGGLDDTEKFGLAVEPLKGVAVKLSPRF
eukprot:TRINITY_DN27271_c0_g1_i1.p1 TRINITY_DN27271_c0_g1~~TRINITY_DN27271_c0_g1_i1.p1  ORF type:complete len:535 (+),score=85.58 TRINITY_DN27271_c0_g1_i1:431-2035(+)